MALAARNGKNGAAGLAAEEQRGLALAPHALGGALGAAKVGAGALYGALRGRARCGARALFAVKPANVRPNNRNLVCQIQEQIQNI